MLLRESCQALLDFIQQTERRELLGKEIGLTWRRGGLVAEDNHKKYREGCYEGLHVLLGRDEL